MTEHVTRTQALSVNCPRCDAPPGTPCFGARDKPRESCHSERHDQYRHTQPTRDRRPYDMHADYLDDDGWTPAPLIETDGRIAYPLDPDTAARGIAHIATIRTNLITKAKQRHPSVPGPKPDAIGEDDWP